MVNFNKVLVKDGKKSSEKTGIQTQAVLFEVPKSLIDKCEIPLFEKDTSILKANDFTPESVLTVNFLGIEINKFDKTLLVFNLNKNTNKIYLNQTNTYTLLKNFSVEKDGKRYIQDSITLKIKVIDTGTDYGNGFIILAE